MPLKHFDPLLSMLIDDTVLAFAHVPEGWNFWGEGGGGR